MNQFIDDFHFLRPLWLLGLPLSIGLWIWMRYQSRRTQNLADPIAPHLLSHLVIAPKHTSMLSPANLLLPMWCLAIIAVAGPAWQRQPSPFADDQAQLMIILNLSDSMLTDDLPPSRLEQARGKLSELLKKRGGAGTGLIAYSGSAHLVMPVTDDADVIDHMLQALSPDVMPSQGDALLDAIGLASEQLSKNANGGSVLVVTDGVAEKNITALSALPSTSSPLQFYVPLRTDEAIAASGVPKAANVSSSSWQAITADQSDIQTLLATADRAIVSFADEKATAWQDAGYYLLPLLALGSLAWSRRGWSLGQ